MWSTMDQRACPVSLAYAAFFVLIFVGVLGFARSGVAGPGRGARIGTVVALAGTALFFAGELLSIPVADQRLDETGAGLVTACFGVGNLLSAIGFIVAGVATVRAGQWDGWRRFVPLATGIWLVVLLGLVATPALAIGVGLYGLCLTALGVALWTQPTPSTPRSRTDAIQSGRDRRSEGIIRLGQSGQGRPTECGHDMTAQADAVIETRNAATTGPGPAALSRAAGVAVRTLCVPRPTGVRGRYLMGDLDSSPATSTRSWSRPLRDPKSPAEVVLFWKGRGRAWPIWASLARALASRSSRYGFERNGVTCRGLNSVGLSDRRVAVPRRRRDSPAAPDAAGAPGAPVFGGAVR